MSAPAAERAKEKLRGMSPEALETVRRQLGPSFASPEQQAFYRSQARELLYSGWMGAGKSRILCEKAWHLALTYPGITVGIFRKVAASIPATTLRTFLKDVMELDQIRAWNLGERWYELRNGSRIYFLGLDPDPITGVPSKIGSLELAWAGVDEAVEVTASDWMMLLGRLRDPRIPFHQLAAATNPAHPKHWLLLHFTQADDPDRMMLRASANRFLPSDYQSILDSLGDSAVGRRLGKGEWAAVEGAIWTLGDWQVRPPDGPSRRVVAGLDWGFVHPFVVEVLGQSSTGRLAVLGELTAKGMGVDQLAEPLATLAEHHGIDAFHCDPSEPGLMDQLSRGLAEHRRFHQDCKLRAAVVAATNDVLPGLQAVDKALRGGMSVDPSCQQLLAEIPGYTWMPDRKGGYLEKPVELNDDACDALRYAVMAYEPNPKDPWGALSAGQAGGVA